MKKAAVVAAAVLSAVAYVGGRWPERERRLALMGEVGMLQSRLEDAEARVRMGELLAELQSLMEVVAQKNYGEAQQLSSRFFDHARAELVRTPQSAFKEALEAVLPMRDGITAALAQADPAVLQRLKQAEQRLRGALGFRGSTATPGAPPVAPPAASPASSLPPGPES